MMALNPHTSDLFGAVALKRENLTASNIKTCSVMQESSPALININRRRFFRH